MSQSDFAFAYGVPLATLKNWEQGRRSPSATEMVYLKIIALAPDNMASYAGVVLPLPIKE